MKQWNELSYKEKFIRTLIIIPFAIIACIIAYYFFPFVKAAIAISAVVVTLVWQLVFTYTKWKNGE